MPSGWTRRAWRPSAAAGRAAPATRAAAAGSRPASQRACGATPVSLCDPPVVVVDEEALQPRVELRAGSAPAPAAVRARRGVAGQRAEEQLVDGLEEALDLAPPAGHAGAREDQRASCRSAATCSRCREVKSLPWSV